jgi:hypothetical protein
MKRPTITQAQVDALKASGRAVAIYPRKKLVVVDGFKYFRLV